MWSHPNARIPDTGVMHFKILVTKGRKSWIWSLDQTYDLRPFYNDLGLAAYDEIRP